MPITCDKNYAYIQLSRGGICIRRLNIDDSKSPDFLNLQIGSPPETIKDTLNNPEWPVGVPRDFIVPERLIDPRSIVTLGDLEFPGYYHYFIRPEKQNIRVHLNSEEQAEQLKIMLNEAVFGPRIDIDEFKKDFSNPDQVFDISKECDYFNQFTFEDIFILNVKQPNESKLKISPRYDLAVQQKSGIYFYKLYELGNASPIFACSEIDLFSRKKMVQKRNPMVRRHDFAISSIGNSTGFDEKGETSGFVIWVNGHGIMIDPPANTRFWLMENKVLPEETDRVILTHCHSDHDAGLLQRIMENDHLDIYTTRTIWKSFSRKYEKILDDLHPYYRWNEIKAGEIVKIEDADFKFFYSLHSIPTIAFTVRYKDINVFYSSDVRFNRKTYDDMLSKGMIDRARHAYFVKQHITLFKNAQFVLHEAGGDPLHTTLEELDSLDLSIKRKTFVYHLKAEEYEEKRQIGINDFTLITSGMDRHDIKVFSDDEQIPAYPDESFLKYCLLFQEMKMRDVKEIQQSCQIRKIVKGTILFKNSMMPSFEEGDPGGYVYLIYSGMAGVVDGEGKKIKEYHKFDFIGETAVLLNIQRNADVVALEDMVCYAIPNTRFKEIMVAYGSLFKRLEINRESHIEHVLSRSFFTIALSWRARTDFQLNCSFKSYKKGDEIMNGDNERFLFLVSGGVKIMQGECKLIYPVLLSNKLRIDHIGDPDNQGSWNIHRIEALENSTTTLEIGKDGYINFCKRHGIFRWRWRYLKTYFPDYTLSENGGS